MVESDTQSFIAKKEFRKVIFLNVGTLLLLIMGIILLGQLRKTAEEIQTLKTSSTAQMQQSEVAFIQAELANYEDEIADLESLVPTENELHEFASAIGRLESEGVAQDFELRSAQIIADKTGNTGYPFAVTLRGTLEQVDAALRTIQTLPFIVRGVTSTVTNEIVEETGEEIVVLQFGGFIYAVKN